MSAMLLGSALGFVVPPPPMRAPLPPLLPLSSPLHARATSLPSASLETLGTSIAFADQAGNLAGAIFPASLPPYLLFLYFLCYDGNGLSGTAKAGFSSLLLFVGATVATSIVSVKTCEPTQSSLSHWVVLPC